MSASITAVRIYLLTDALGSPLPTPHLLDPATEEIPYGSRAQIQVDVCADEPVISLWSDINTPSTRTFTDEDRCGIVPMFPPAVAAPSRIAETALGPAPAGCHGGLEAPPVFPKGSPLAGWPPISGGQFVFRGHPELASAPTTPDISLGVEAPFRLGRHRRREDRPQDHPSGGDSGRQRCAHGAALACERHSRRRRWGRSYGTILGMPRGISSLVVHGR